MKTGFEEQLVSLVYHSWDKEGRAPGMAWLSERTGKSTRTVESTLFMLKEKEELVYENEMWKVAPKVAPIIIEKEKIPIWVYVVRVVAVLIAIACVIISVRYSQIFFMRRMDYVLSMVFAVVWVTAATLFWQLAKISQDQKYRTRAIAFTLVGIILTVYSMWATFAVQYNNFTHNVIVEQTEDNVIVEQKEQAVLLGESFDKRRGAIEGDKSLYQKEIELYIKQVDDLEPGSYNGNVAAWRKSQAEIKYNGAVEKLEKLDEEESMYLKENVSSLVKNPVEKQNLKRYVDETFNRDFAVIFFLIDTLPPIFVDVVAPLALMVVFFGWKKKESKSETK